MYAAHSSVAEGNLHSFEYRKAKSTFKGNVFKKMNEALDTYKFDVRTSPKASVETDIIITEGDIPIDSKGKGRQCFIKTELRAPLVQLSEWFAKGLLDHEWDFCIPSPVLH